MKGIYIVVVIAMCVAYVSSTPVKHLAAKTNTNTCNNKCEGENCDSSMCWKNKYVQADAELTKFKDRKERKSKNKNLCSKWGSLQNLCNIVMVTEQTAKYPS